MSGPSRSAPRRGALGTVESTFALLVCEPAPLALDGSNFSGLPARLIPLDELRDLLVPRSGTPAVGRVTCDAVWAELITRARGDGPAWVVGAAGVALPGLRSVVRVLATQCPTGSSADLESEVLAGFLAALRSMPVTWRRLAFRLRRAAYQAGVAFLAVEHAHSAQASNVEIGSLADCTATAELGYPDLVLADAVAEGVLSAQDAELIGRTRLEGVPLIRVADQWGVPYSTLRRWRTRAERRLAVQLRTPHAADHERTVDHQPVIP